MKHSSLPRRAIAGSRVLAALAATSCAAALLAAAGAAAAAPGAVPPAVRIDGAARSATRLEGARLPAAMRAALSRLSGAAPRSLSGPGTSVTLGGIAGVPVANLKTHTLYVPLTTSHVVDVINTAKCNVKVASDCRVVARARVRSGPAAAAIDEKTDTIYVVNGGLTGHGDTVSVVNGARCDATVRSGCGRAVATIKVGKGPAVAAFDPATRTVYVTNFLSGSVSVINAAGCNALTTRGCGRAVKTVKAGSGPGGVDVDVATDTVYVANSGLTNQGDTVSVIDGATCNGRNGRGCGQTPRTVTVGSDPSWVAVDQARDAVYVANYGLNGFNGSVSVINGARCNSRTTSGCGRMPPAVPAGNGTAFAAVDNALHTVFAINQEDDTLSAISTRTCNGTATSGCRRRPPNQQAGFNSNAFALVPATGTAYLANAFGSDIISIASIRRCNAANTSGCRAEAPTASTPAFTVSVDPATDTIYTGNPDLPEVDVLNSATCNPQDTSGCAPVAKIPVPKPDPNVGAIDPATHTLYVSNAFSDTVSVINTATCNAADTTGCAAAPPTMKVGPAPGSPVLDKVTRTMYVPFGDAANRVAVANAATCNAQDTTGCGQHPGVAKVGKNTFILAVSAATDTIYGPNEGGDTVSVIDGATCNRADHSGCRHLAATVKVGLNPLGVAVDDRTHTAYVSNFANGDFPGTVSLISTATCNGSDTSGCKGHMPAVPVGRGPYGIAVDTRTSTIYVADFLSAAVSVLNGSRCNAEMTTGCRAGLPQQAVGSGPQSLAVNQRTNTVYVTLSPGISIFRGGRHRHRH